MTGYGSREVSRMLGVSVGQLRSYVRAGFLHPARGPRGELRFSFQDLVLLRTAQGLIGARIAPRRVRSALRKLRSQLPEGRTLREVHIRAEGDRIARKTDRSCSTSTPRSSRAASLRSRARRRTRSTRTVSTSADATWRKPILPRPALRTGAPWSWIRDTPARW